MASPPDFSRRIPQLDGLRGIAVLMVVAYHYVNYGYDAGAPRFSNLLLQPVSLGWTGVDLFFVLSGFLIGGILLDARGSRNYFRVFYRRRVCRIFPMYFLLLGAAFLAVYCLRPPFDGIFRREIPALTLATFTQNFWMAIHNQLGEGALKQTWSLAIEEQFYLTLPAVIYFVKSPKTLVRVIVAGIVLANLVRAAMVLAGPSLNTAVFVLLPTRMDSLLLGVALALFLRRPGSWEYLHAHRRQMWTLTEALTIAGGLFLLAGSPTTRVTMLLGYSCFGLLYTCILALALVDDSVAQGLQQKWLMGVGTISYCVYLIHVLVFGLVLDAVKNYQNRGVIAAVLGFAATIGVAKLSWKWFERPLVNFGHKESYEQSAPRETARVPVS